jgi:hypothetical protein
MPSNAQILSSSEEISVYESTGAADEVTFRANEARALNQERWDTTIDTLLAWLRENATGAIDAPVAASIESAIDLAIDSREKSLAPTSVALTDDGGAAFEWRFGDEVVTIEIVASGLAELTHFRRSRVVLEAILHRNPKTRSLELRGSSGE